MKIAMIRRAKILFLVAMLASASVIAGAEETTPATNDAPAHAPAFEHLQMIPPMLIVIFKFTGGGLVSKTGENVEGFMVASADRKFFPAKAKIVHEVIRLTSSEVKVPVAARYSWGTNSTASLFGKNGLPVAPFRTDSWPDPAAK
jgi:sialate O-acetylesterase